LFYTYRRNVQENIADESYEWAPGEQEWYAETLTRLYEAARAGLPATYDADVTAAREDLEETIAALGLPPVAP
jgi:hypothetical protein